MELAIDKSSPIAIGEQLKAQVRLLVHSGQWQAGARLPTVKELAARLGLNPNTVAAAYRELEGEGYLLQRRRAGTRVADKPPRSAGYGAAAELAAGFAEALERCGLDMAQGVTLAVAQANLAAGTPPVRVAVLARTPLEAAQASMRAGALLGSRYRCVPQTPENYHPSDYGLSIIDPGLATELRDQSRRRFDLMPAGGGAAVQYSRDFPAGAD